MFLDFNIKYLEKEKNIIFIKYFEGEIILDEI